MKRTALYPPLFAAVFVLIGAGIGMLTAPGMSWYAELEKPALNPPDMAFPVVWTLLYIFLGIVFGRIVAAGAVRKHTPVFVLFSMQMLMNWVWSFLFFSLHLLFLSWLWIAAMVILSIALTALLAKTDKISAVLMLPYIGWISFAALLAYRVWSLNQSAPGP